MEYMLDTTCIKTIKKYMGAIPISGITSTPSIIKREGKIDFFAHMKETLTLISDTRSLHMQVVAKDYEGMVQDALSIWAEIGSQVYVKIPATENGLRALYYLKSQDSSCRITASAVYSKMQAFLALESGADYIAVYTNRSENTGVDPFDVIRSAKNYIQQNSLQGKVMASSIKNVLQVTEAIDAGVDAITFAPTILLEAFDLAAPKQAVDRFTADWEFLYGQNHI